MIQVNTRVCKKKLTGVQRYIQELLAYFPENTYQEMMPPQTQKQGFKAHLWEQVVLPYKTQNKLLWSPSNSGPIYKKKHVLTIHDLVPIDHPEYLSKRFASWYQWLLPRLAHHCDHILTVSEFSKSRIIDRLSVPEKKVTVTHLAPFELGVLSTATHTAIAEKFKKMGIHPQRYIFTLGSIEPRKNLHSVLSAWTKLQNELPSDYTLVIAGLDASKELSHVFADMALGNLPKSVKRIGYIQDAEIQWLMSNTTGFIYPSFYEGFGLPVMESMACGAPVITSQQSSMSEFASDCSILVNPHASEDIAQAMLDLIQQPDLRQKLSDQAKIQVKKFSWQKTAKKTLDVLNEYK